MLVDMDGVLADFDGATTAYLVEHHPDIAIAERNNFYYRDDYPDPAHQAIINQLHASRHFFANLPVIDGALEGWERLYELGYEPRVCSSPLHTNEWCEAEKRDWLGRHLGRSVAMAAILTTAKHEYDGVALLDDRPTIRHADQASWQHVVFGASYNRGVPSELRITGWRDEALPDVLARAAAISQARRK